MFFEPARTPYDLNFRLFGVEVRVHPWFWAMSAITGWSLVRELGFVYLLLWVACVFVSILVHELGHIFMGLVFGSRGHIVMYSLGGLAVGSNRMPRHWQRILVSLAGPGAGFALFGLVWLVGSYVDMREATRPVRVAYDLLKQINLFWGFVNLLPVWPLDGGQVSRDLLDWLMGSRGARLSYVISLVTAGVLAINALYLENHEQSIWPLSYVPFLEYAGGIWLAVLFAALAFTSYQALQAESHRYQRWDRDDDSWGR
ncbi:MAG TPA: site-2 protease family protein [Gemmataceae bacterium]|nr:site-2 protease family protein [Gemmataceae bacterium]